MSEFQTLKADFSQHRIVDTDDTSIEEGEILVKVDHFAFTANNITYAAMGDRLGYWQFFPPNHQEAEAQETDVQEIVAYGIIPVWGFADVVASNVEGIPIGERFFGYFPPAHQLKMSPVHISEARFVDGAAHRSQLPSGYNMYRRLNAEPGYSKDQDAARMLLFPLHVTSWCLWDYLKDKEWFGATQAIIVSASSKTSIGLGYALHTDDTAPATIGLTSSRNLDFVNALGYYDHSFAYEDVSHIDASKPTVIVDMSGNSTLLGKLHTHLGENMKFCSNVGLTHWDKPQKGEGIISDRSEVFFAPSHIQNRIKDWGIAEFDKQSIGFMMRSAQAAQDWMKVETVSGLQGLAEIYDDICTGNISPEKGLVVKL